MGGRQIMVLPAALLASGLVCANAAKKNAVVIAQVEQKTIEDFVKSGNLEAGFKFRFVEDKQFKEHTDLFKNQKSIDVCEVAKDGVTTDNDLRYFYVRCGFTRADDGKTSWKHSDWITNYLEPDKFLLNIVPEGVVAAGGECTEGATDANRCLSGLQCTAKESSEGKGHVCSKKAFRTLEQIADAKELIVGLKFKAEEGFGKGDKVIVKNDICTVLLYDADGTHRQVRVECRHEDTTGKITYDDHDLDNFRNYGLKLNVTEVVLSSSRATLNKADKQNKLKLDFKFKFIQEDITSVHPKLSSSDVCKLTDNVVKDGEDTAESYKYVRALCGPADGSEPQAVWLVNYTRPNVFDFEIEVLKDKVGGRDAANSEALCNSDQYFDADLKCKTCSKKHTTRAQCKGCKNWVYSYECMTKARYIQEQMITKLPPAAQAAGQSAFEIPLNEIPEAGNSAAAAVCSAMLALLAMGCRGLHSVRVGLGGQWADTNVALMEIAEL